MTSGSTFPQRLTKVDALTLPDHSYLTAADECYFLGEYTARGGYSFSATNDLVLNFKKSVRLRGQPQWKWKAVAITQAASAFAVALNSQWLDTATLVPVPPSKAKSDPLFDDRVMRMLHAIRPNGPLDIRELVVQRQSTAAAHELQSRPRPLDLLQHYQCDPAVLAPPPQVIGIFDDVLTTGAHFKAVQGLLQVEFPRAKIIGLFIARRVPESVDPDEFDVV
jgi:hypothetical protein